MSDHANYYPPGNEVIKSRAWIPCLKCGAMVHGPLKGLHVEWHEAEIFNAKADALDEAARDGWNAVIELSELTQKVPPVGYLHAWLIRTAAEMRMR